MNDEQEVMDGPMAMTDWTATDLVASGRTVQQVRTQYSTAVSVQRPRNMVEVKKRLLQEAALMGDAAYYAWGTGKNRVEGISIDLACAAARCWGNCATDMLPVQDLEDSWIFTATFIDLETGYTRTRQFRQSKEWGVAGRFDDERKADIRFQLGQSKAERNVILKALPNWLLNQALEAAKEGVRKELDDLEKKHGRQALVDRLIAALVKCGVKEEAILRKCGVVERKGISKDDLVTLRGDYNQITAGTERAEVLFPPAPPEASEGEVRPGDAPPPEAV